MQRPINRGTRGFTLVELLVVILIISILLTLGATALKGAGGKGTSSALAGTEALFDEARSVAIGRGTRTRVLVDVDDPDQEDYYLRRVVVAYEEVDDDGEGTGSWKLASRALQLPAKTFFSQKYSRGGSGNLESFELTGNGGMYNGNYVYYEFNSEGICTSGLNGDNYEAPRFVIGAGVRGIGQERPRATGEGRRDFAGFVIWRNGATSVFRDANQIIGGDEPKEF